MKYTPIQHEEYEECKRANEEILEKVSRCNDKKKEFEEFEKNSSILSKLGIPNAHQVAQFISASPFIHQGSLTVLKIVQTCSTNPLIDPFVACNGKKGKYHQYTFGTMIETRFGHRHDGKQVDPFWDKFAIYNITQLSGRELYFLRFGQILMCCKKNVEHHNGMEVLSLIHLGSRVKFEIIQDHHQEWAVLRLLCEECILYLAGKRDSFDKWTC